MNPRDYYLIQIAVGALFLFLAWFFLRPRSESGFKLREADRLNRPKGKDNDLAQARMKRQESLSLPGIRIDGEPHEILGISRMATPDEVQKAYRELMKRYHPDLVGPPDSRQWKDAQKIAEALNSAKEKMLKRPR